MPSIGLPELLIVLVVVLVLFGAQKLPLLGRGLGEGIRNFRTGLKDDNTSNPSSTEATKPE